MTKLRFEWNDTKAQSNLRKHGVSFATAARIFLDPDILTKLDRIVDYEERWQTLGRVDDHLMLLVAHTTWEEDDHGEFIEVIRIISARPAEKHERREYDIARVQNRQI
ncbi:BrnT family toxin [Asticcacaulis sp. YBE204]|uniref:BrnT family toxin n=1 Tax=Asticcacaulis sp. YBE204 TaxID=1282363 RepID=UPI0009DF6F59|nr:BrnT family toxin [Asticcacaulis sp. YBE204]